MNGTDGVKLPSPLQLKYIFGGLLESSLVVGLLFLPQNVGLVVGTYKGLLPFCECRQGGWDISALYMLMELFVVTGGGDPKT